MTRADIQELLMSRSVLALVNGEPWDMHRPLVENCELHFLHFKDEDPSLSNEVSVALWPAQSIGATCVSWDYWCLIGTTLPSAL